MTNEECLKYSEDLISKNTYAIIGTISNKKYPNTRVLKVMKRDNLKTFYFSTKENSLKVKQIKKNKKGCILFYDESKFASVMIEGKFEIQENKLFEVSNFYDLDSDPYDFCNLIFKSEILYLYVPYTKYEIKIEE